MKAKDIITKLQQMNPEAEVVVAVRTHTQRYPQAYVSPFEVEVGSERIYISLPEGQSISTRKVK